MSPGASRRRLAAHVLAWTATLVVLVISLIPVNVPPEVDEYNLDKVVHAAMYATLMALYAGAHARALWPRIALILAAYGGVIEVLQGFTPYRTASIFDALANATGVSIVLGLLVLRARKSGNRHHDPLQTGPLP